MTFVREIQHFGRNPQSLQRREELKPLADIEPIVELAVNRERRRFEFVGEQMGGKFPVQLPVFPWRSFEFPFRKPKFFRRPVCRLCIKHPIVRHYASESIGVTEDPVGHVAAIART